MKAAVYSRFQDPVRIETVADPEPGAGGVVIKVMASGMCLSDWHGWMGHDPDIALPHVPGHEFAGIIEAVGKKVKKWKVGQRVTVPFVGGCGQCVYCKEGNQQVCDHQFQPGFTAWGSFAEYVAVDYADVNLVELPPELSFVNAASLGCRFVTAYRALADQAELKPGQWLAVYGCGGVGLSAIQIGKALGARVIAIDISDEKCAFAKSLGADYSVNGMKSEAVETVREISRGGVHASMDALGSSLTCLNSIQSLRKGGKHLQVGLLPEGMAAPKIPMGLLIAHELQLIGSHGMQAHRYHALFELIENADIRLAELVSATVSLVDVPRLLPGMNNIKLPGICVVNSFS
jgi:alcohol dehydrogenase